VKKREKREFPLRDGGKRLQPKKFGERGTKPIHSKKQNGGGGVQEEPKKKSGVRERKGLWIERGKSGGRKEMKGPRLE